MSTISLPDAAASLAGGTLLTASGLDRQEALALAGAEFSVDVAFKSGRCRGQAVRARPARDEAMSETILVTGRGRLYRFSPGAPASCRRLDRTWRR